MRDRLVTVLGTPIGRCDRPQGTGAGRSTWGHPAAVANAAFNLGYIHYMDIMYIFYGHSESRIQVTMHINLSPEMEQYIKSKVGSGFYGNSTEVIRDAIRRMQAAEHHNAALLAAVAIGDAQLDRGEGDAYTPSLLERLTHKALHDPPDGNPVDPDVLP